MTTPKPNPLELAKQGNIRAISFLINRSLRTKDITAKTAFRDGCLYVILESSEIPDQAILASFIYKGIVNLEVASIKKLRVYGKRIIEDRPVWSEEFDLLGQTETVLSTNVNESFEPSNTLQLNVSENERTQTQSQVNSTAQLSSSQSNIQTKKVEVKDQVPVMIRQGCLGCLGISFFVIVGLYILGLFVDNNQPTSSVSSSPVLSSPIEIEKKPEELLAAIDGQPQKTAEYASLLDQLMPKCQEDRMFLADMAVKTQELLTQKGARANNLQILNAAYQTVKPYGDPQRCAVAFSLIATTVNQ